MTATPLAARAAATAAAAAHVPPAPKTIEDTGLTGDQIAQLLIKTLYTGETTGTVLSDRLRLPYGLLQAVVEHIRAERLIEVRGAAGSGNAAYRYALTDLGRDRAQQYLAANAYVGPAPVPLAAYVEMMKTLRESGGFISRDRLAKAFAHLVIPDQVLEQLGPAVNAGRAMFLYGAPGNGKTAIAETLGRALGGDMYVPYALDVDGQTVTLFDPITHTVIEVESSSSIVQPAPRDRRWAHIRRPAVTVGGELTLDQLEIRFNEISKFHEAPVQLKANGGVFLVDDFGRQRISPEELLNRWIVPLENRVDYLTLHTGKKFQVPFDVLIIFATNLDPASLADEAFLRRIPYKIAIDDPSLDQFIRIFELNCLGRTLKFHPVLVAYLHRRHYAPFGRHLRACHPRDLLDQVAALCRYRGHGLTITRELLDAACRAYFVDDLRGSSTAAAPGGPRGRSRPDRH